MEPLPDDADGILPPELLARESELLRMNSELDARRAAAANRQRERAAAAAAVSSATAAATAATAGGSVDRTSTHTTARDRDRDGAAASHLPSRLPRRSAVARPMASTEATASAGASGGSAPVAVAVGGGASAGSPHRRRGSGRGAHHRGSPARAASPIRASGHTPTSTSTSARPRVRQSPGTGRADGRRTGREPADGSGARSGAPVASPHADADAAANGLGLEAKVAYQRARLTMLKDERDHAIAARKELEKEVKALRKAASGHSAAVAKLQRAVQVAEGQGKKDAKRAATSQAKVESLTAQVKALRKDLDGQQRAARSASSESNSRDVRLQRALAEVDRLQERLRTARSSQQEGTESLRSKLTQQADEIRRLERHKTELLSAFKKQLRLIDILKRQKVHIEAARMLAFTEDEFAKTLNMGV